MLFAWFAKMEGLGSIADAHVARTKLNWWRDEIRRCYKGKANHPLARALGEFTARRAIDPSDLEQIGAEMNRHFMAGGFDSLDQFQAHHRATGGGFARLLTLATRYSGDEDDAVADAGAFYTAVDVLSRLGAELASFAPRIEKTAIAAFRESASKQETTESLVESLCQDALTLHPQRIRDLPVPAAGLASLAEARLREVSGAGALVLENAVDLTPLRKLWIVWRAA